MNDQDLSGFEGLADLGLRGGAQMRPTLLRVLTDLYVQKLTHTPEEERHYTELALRLLDGVDAATRLAVGSRLARHLSPPLQVLQHLAQDLQQDLQQDLEQDLQQDLHREPPTNGAAAAVPVAEAKRISADPDDLFAGAPQAIDADVAARLNEMFFAADANERRLILINLEIVAPLPAGALVVTRNAAIGQRLEAAALARRREDFAQNLTQALQIPRPQARRILDDNLGEPLLVAGRALGIARDAIYRILMFVNPVVGHSVERVHALAALYDEITEAAAENMVAIWQALPKGNTKGDNAPAQYRPVTAGDEPSLQADVRSRPAAQRPWTAAPPRERRGAS